MKISKQEKEWLLREKYNGKETPDFLADLKRLEAGEPLGYVIGNVPFLDCTIDLTLRPLIPRIETEYWVAQALPQIKNEASSHQALHILDVFSGSGCIGVSALKSLPQARVDFLEKDPTLKKQISINLTKNGIASTRAKIIIGDALRNIPKKKYDYIFANPPYIPQKLRTSLSPSVTHFEPHLALFAPDDGLYYIKHLAKLTQKILTPGGKMWTEFGYGQKEKIEAFLKKGLSPEVSYRFLRDQNKKWRVLELSCKMGR